MSLDVVRVAYGDPAFEALSAAIRAAKEDDPFRLVTVVVPRGAVGLATRRRLASAPPGVLNVRHLVLARLAGELAVAWLAGAGRRPIATSLVYEAVRAALAGCGDGVLPATGDQPSTVRAMVRTYREMAAASTRTLDLLAGQSPRARQVVGVIRAVRQQLAGRYDEVDLLRAAQHAVLRAPERLAELTGPVVVHLPTRLGPAEADLLEALAAAVDVTVVVGLTGDEGADEPAAAIVRRLVGPPSEGDADPTIAGVGRAIEPVMAPTRPTAGSLMPVSVPVAATEVWTAPSADAEVLMAVRRLMTLHERGTPLERMALLHGGNDPHPRLVHDVLAAAGLPFNGGGIRPLSATVPGRALVGCLELGDGGWRREDVIDWIAGAPLRHGGQPVPDATWDLLSCQAGVIAGLGEWRDRLVTHAADLRRRAARAERREREADDAAGTTTGPLPDALRRDAAQCADLLSFVEDVAARLTEPVDTWAGWAEWGRRLLRDLLGDAARRDRWPIHEAAAFEAVSEVLANLAALDELGGRPGLSRLRMALQAELEVPAPQTARSGRGILTGPVAAAVGLDLDVVWVLGMTDGSFPAPATDDVLIPDRERERVDAEHEVPRRQARRAESHRDLLAALAGASVRVLSYPVGDQRTGRELRPARPVLDALGNLAGAGRIYAKDLPLTGAALRAAAGTVRAVPSLAAAVTSGWTPVDLGDWDLRALTRWVESGVGVDRHFLAHDDAVVAGGLAMRRGRRRSTFTRYDGGIGGIPAPSPAGGVARSATRLEEYARCPRRYLFGTVLELSARDRPEELLRISPLDRGLAVHRILEEFVSGQILRSAPEPISPERSWGPDDEEELLRIADEIFADLEAGRRAGRPAMWEVDRVATLASLRRFLRQDERHRRERQAVPVAVEETFGMATGGDPVLVGIGGGRTVPFKGRIDRMDRTSDDGVAVVDYKSGRAGAPDGPDGDPLAGGTSLQLAVYGLAARQRLRPAGAVVAGYWRLGAEDGPAWIDLSPEIEERLTVVVGAIVDAIESGVFPARPGPARHGSAGANCAVCPFDAMCPTDRRRQWERKRSDRRLADYLALAEPAPGGEPAPHSMAGPEPGPLPDAGSVT